MIRQITIALGLLLLAMGVACNNNKVTNLDAGTVKDALHQAGFNDVDATVDKDKGVVRLGGKVQSEQDKDRAAQVAQGVAGNLVVSNEISVEPPGVEHQAREIESNMDDSIEKNYKAVLIAHHMDKDDIAYKVKNGVITLKGSVKSAQERHAAEKLAAGLPHVTQVVNELDVKGRGHQNNDAAGR